jgi:hypothetical protein
VRSQRCPCCGYKTIDGDFDICQVCFWQKDSVAEQDDEPGGANSVSLSQAKENYKKYGAMEERFLENVRAPKVDEL